jgi:hypothetical protein
MVDLDPTFGIRTVMAQKDAGGGGMYVQSLDNP